MAQQKALHLNERPDRSRSSNWRRCPSCEVQIAAWMRAIAISFGETDSFV
jgi:hypothetical protein